MNKIIKPIDEGVRYLSDWKEFESLPKGQHFILAKEICGCGATEAYLRSKEPLILAMPRKHLLYNKYSQHIGNNVFLYRFLSKDQYFNDKDPSKAELEEYDNRFIDYLRNGGTKILTTYDSLDKLTKLMKQEGVELTRFRVVVDEFQQIIGDAPFKATVEHQFYMALKKFDTVVYLSATPFLTSYLEMTEQFRDLTIIQLEWPETAIKRADVKTVKLTKTITEKCCEIIQDYKSGNAPSVSDGGSCIVSKEAVFFLNDVQAIIRVIKKARLTPEEVNILCAPRSENYKRINELNNGKSDTDKKFSRGEIPGKGEPHKKFTFCTSTVYIGADFNSESAYTYIFANPNVESLTIDVGTDIQQIVGRQRLDENPFRLKATFFYYLKKPLISEDEMEKVIKTKRSKTNEHIVNFENAVYKDTQLESMEALIKKGHTDHYCCISVNEHGKKTIVENGLIAVAEKRAWDIANTVYRGDLTLLKVLKNSVNIIPEVDSSDPEVRKIFEVWSKDHQFKRQAMIYCELKENKPDLLVKCDFIPSSFQKYYDALGRKGFEDMKWRLDNIKVALAPTPPDKIPHEKIVSELISRFPEGKEYPKEDIKNELINIYQTLGIKGKPSAADIKRYFTIADSSMRVNKKKVATFKILSHWQKGITIFSSITSVVRPVMKTDTDSVLDIIQNGLCFNLRLRVAKLRATSNDKKFAALKAALPVATWNGIFNYRDSLGCEIYSSLTALDFDHVENLSEIENWLRGFPCVYAYFRTPSGNGIKAIVLHDNRRKENHADLYAQLLIHFKCKSQDSSTSDLGRGNYLSHDTAVWRNSNPVPFHYEPSEKQPEGIRQTYTVTKDETGKEELTLDNNHVCEFLDKLTGTILTDESIINILRTKWNQSTIKRGRNNTALTYAGVLCKAGIEKKKAQDFIQELIPDLPSKEIFRAVKYAYEKNIFGLNRRTYKKR